MTVERQGTVVRDEPAGEKLQLLSPFFSGTRLRESGRDFSDSEAGPPSVLIGAWLAVALELGGITV